MSSTLRLSLGITVAFALRLVACGGDASDGDALFASGDGAGGVGGTSSAGGTSSVGGTGTTTGPGTGGTGTSGASAGTTSVGGSVATGGTGGSDPFGGGGSSAVGGSGTAGTGLGMGGTGPGPGPGGGPGMGGSTGSSGKGGSGTAGSSTGGNIIPVTCQQAHNYPGCCGADGKVYWCEMNSTMVTSEVCNAGTACSWDALNMLYGCNGTQPSDPSGKNPHNCGP